QPDAKRAMEKLIKEHPEIDAVLSANDSMSLGVLEALKEANRTATVISVNGILPAVKKVETGEILATVDFNMFKIGCMATRAAVRQIKSETLPEKVMLPTEIIDKTNYQAWLTPVEKRACPEWRDLVKGSKFCSPRYDKRIKTSDRRRPRRGRAGRRAVGGGVVGCDQRSHPHHAHRQGTRERSRRQYTLVAFLHPNGSTGPR